MSKNTTWFTHPSKKQMILFTSIWLISISLLVLAFTDMFQKPILSSLSTPIKGLMVGSTLSFIKLQANYWKNKSTTEESKTTA